MTEYLANSRNYGGKRALSTIKYIVIHYTGNDGDTAMNNAKYFRNNVVEVSAHYFVDDEGVTRSVPDNYIAWHCGSSTYYCPARNTNSIGVEMCDTERNGKYNLSAKTKANTISLVVSLMKKYGIGIDGIYRHYDVSHKLCPAYLVDNKAWAAFKAEITAAYNKAYAPTKKAYTGVFPSLPKRGYIQKGDEGNNVRYLQTFLNWYGGYKLDVDGDFGVKTLAAVKDFQKKEKIAVDGLFGKNSLKAAKAVKK